MALADLAARIREALGVSSSYDEVIIPAAIRRRMTSLLRDYHFPKSVKREEYPAMLAGAEALELPVGFKKELALRFYSPTDDAWTEPLRKRESFVLAQHLYPEFYWLEGAFIQLVGGLPDGYAGTTAVLWYESMDPVANEWMLVDLEDVLFTYTVMRMAAEQRKPEVMQAFAGLWAEDQRSIAIYANELEFGSLDMMQREVERSWTPRYPSGAYDF